MWHRVAALLGGRTVEELQAVMSSAEFTRWCAFYGREPWGYEVENWRMGVLGATVANWSGRPRRPLKPSDFMPGKKPKRRALSEAELAARMQALTEKNGRG